MSECLLYYLNEGDTRYIASVFNGIHFVPFRVGRVDASDRPDIILSGDAILPIHCVFRHEDGAVELEPMKVLLLPLLLPPPISLIIQGCSCVCEWTADLN